jgi:hypothetical protein
MAEVTFNISDDKISVADLGDGRHVVMETPGGATIVAYVSDGKASRYEAADPTGQRQQLFVVRPDSADARITPDGFCMVCTFEADFSSVFCTTVVECPPDLGPTLEGPH